MESGTLGGLRGLTVLLVEEEALIAMDIEQQCYDHGAAKVATVSSLRGITAEMLSDVQAAVLDLKVGDGSTVELALQLRERNIPFIFATGYTDLEQVLARFPDVTVVAKPYSGSELIDALAATLRHAPSGDG